MTVWSRNPEENKKSKAFSQFFFYFPPSYGFDLTRTSACVQKRLGNKDDDGDDDDDDDSSGGCDVWWFYYGFYIPCYYDLVPTTTLMMIMIMIMKIKPRITTMTVEFDDGDGG